MSLDNQKKLLREKMVGIIKENDLSAFSFKANQILKQRFCDFNLKMATYWPFKTEIDLTPFMNHYHQKNGMVLLPSINLESKVLNFYRWDPEETLIQGPHHTTETSEKIADIPDIVITPLIACDHENFRLGRGGGYYDQTIAFYQTTYAHVKFMSIVMPCQVVKHIPREHHDQKLDEIILLT